MAKGILNMVTNVGQYADGEHPTGLWLSELTHAWEVFDEAGFEQTLVSPAGGEVPLEPRVDSADYDAIYFTGGHAVMYDFPGSAGLQRITRELYERGAIVSSVCHGYCGLLDVTLSDGSYLIAGKKMTGFAWLEERLARVDKLVPYNAEAKAKERGAHYEKGTLPFLSYAVVDGNLVTGQNPGSAKETAEKVAVLL